MLRKANSYHSPDANRQGFTPPLHWAVEWNNLNAVNLLLANRANPTLKDNEGMTPLELSRRPYKNVGAQIAVGNAITKLLEQAMKIYY